MPYFNQIIVLGHLGKNAETRTAGEFQVINFSLATSYGKADKKKSTWHNVTAFDLPDFVKDGLKKGTLVQVIGRQENDSYEDKDGNKKYYSKIMASQVMIFNSQESETDARVPSPYQAPEDVAVEDNDDLPF